MIEWNNSTVRPTIVVGAIILLLLGLFVTFLMKHRYAEYYQSDLGASSEAKTNPFLAADFFMKEIGSAIELKRDFSILDDDLSPEHAIIFTNSRKPLKPSKIEKLKAYVERGGHLVLTAVEPYDDDRQASGSPLMDELGARLYVDEEVSRETSIFGITFQSGEPSIASFTFSDYENATEVEFLAHHYLVDASGDASYVGGSEESNHLIQYHLGDGVISIVSDIRFLESDKINERDHAMFLYQLVGAYDKVWLIYNPVVPSLPVLLWQHAYYIVISSIVLLLLTIWFYQLKTGPIFPQFSVNRRQLIQHIQASAEFKWHHCDANYLLNQTREELLSKINRRQKQFSSLPREKQIEQLHHWTNIAEADIQAAFFADDFDQWGFLQQIRTLQQVRKTLYGNA